MRWKLETERDPTGLVAANSIANHVVTAMKVMEHR